MRLYETKGGNMRRMHCLVVGALATALLAVASADAAAGSRENVVSLQRRLTDAGCYKGAIDGAPSAALDAAVKVCPDQAPVLRIETGMHSAPISRVGVDGACERPPTTSPCVDGRSPRGSGSARCACRSGRRTPAWSLRQPFHRTDASSRR